MRNTQVQVEEIRNQKYARLGGMDGKIGNTEGRWNGWKIGKILKVRWKDERLGILKVSRKG